jgi:hypothetical protein
VVAVEAEQAVACELACDFSRGPHQFGSEVAFERDYVDACVEPQAEEPCFFVLLHAIDPRGFNDSRSGEILFQIVGSLCAQNWLLFSPTWRDFDDWLTG